MRLTDMSIRALKPAADKHVICWDDTLAGFGVRVAKGGTKSYVLTHGVRRQRETIGRVGVLGLQEARSEARRRLAEYTLGKTKPTSPTWNGALEPYLTDLRLRRKAGTVDEYERLLKKHFRFGETRLSDLTPADIQQKLDRLTGSEQFHAFTAVRPFLNWAYRKHYVEENPIARMEPPDGSRPRERILTDDELKRVWAAAGDETFGVIVKLLILTGQRVGEISKLTREMVGGDDITLPSCLTKNSRTHTFPTGALSRKLLALRTTKESSEGTGPLLPARGSCTSFSGFSKSKLRLDERSKVTDWTLHDLRRTYASGMASLGVALPVIERLLNHVSGSFAGIVGVYQRYNFEPEMRAAVLKWETHVAKLVRPVRIVAA